MRRREMGSPVFLSGDCGMGLGGKVGRVHFLALWYEKGETEVMIPSDLQKWIVRIQIVDLNPVSLVLI
jgi:hypothetical protein